MSTHNGLFTNSNRLFESIGGNNKVVKTITFTSDTTFGVTVEFNSVISSPNNNHYIDIDNFSISNDTTVWENTNICGVDRDYRYGFNNQEKENEIYGDKNAYSFEYRIHDARLGRFFSVDPLEKEYPWNSSYAFAENDVIRSIDLEGAEKYIVTIQPVLNGGILRLQVNVRVDYSQKYSLEATYRDLNGNFLKVSNSLADLFFIRKEAVENVDFRGHKMVESVVNGKFQYNDGWDNATLSSFMYCVKFAPIPFYRTGVQTTIASNPIRTRVPPPPPTNVSSAFVGGDSKFVDPVDAQNQINAALAAMPAGVTSLNITIFSDARSADQPNTKYGTVGVLLEKRQETIRGMFPSNITLNFNTPQFNSDPSIGVSVPTGLAFFINVPNWTTTITPIQTLYQLNADGTMTKIGEPVATGPSTSTNSGVPPASGEGTNVVYDPISP